MPVFWLLAAVCVPAVFTGCRAPKGIYGPMTENVGAAPGGQPAAIYEIPYGRRKGGQVQVWTDGIMDDGRPTRESDRPESRPRSFRVGLIVRNDSSRLLSVDPSDVRLLLDEIPDLRPRETRQVAVAPGLSSEILLRYPLPGRFERLPPDSYKVAWSVQFGTETYRQITPFTRQRERGWVPRPLDSSSQPDDRPIMDGSKEPEPVGIPWGGEPNQ
jgi:hypothetical protein